MIKDKFINISGSLSTVCNFLPSLAVLNDCRNIFAVFHIFIQPPFSFVVCIPSSLLCAYFSFINYITYTKLFTNWTSMARISWLSLTCCLTARRAGTDLKTVASSPQLTPATTSSGDSLGENHNMQFAGWYLKIAAVGASIGAAMELFMIHTGFCTSLPP